MDLDYLPDTERVATILQTFSTSPFANNHDPSDGISIHLDAGSARPEIDLGGGGAVPYDEYLGDDPTPLPTTMSASCPDHETFWTRFDVIKDMAPQRDGIYHYMIWADKLACGETAGRSRDAPGADFVVALGGDPGGGLQSKRVAAFMHELGHNLGLLHGGNETRAFKPNYLSIMNPAFVNADELYGGILQEDGTRYFGYSDRELPVLSERALIESAGLGSEAPRLRTRWWCERVLFPDWRFGPAAGEIDWNCDGSISRDALATNIDGQGGYCGGVLGVLGTCDELRGHRDWGNLQFNGLAR